MTQFAKVGVSAIIHNKKGEILLEKRDSKVRFYPGYLGLPGGLVEFGETLEEALKREMKEELGVTIKLIKRVKKVYQELPNKKYKNVHLIGFSYYCKIKGTPKAKDETKEVKWIKPSKIKKMKLAYNHEQILKDEKLI